MAGKQVGGEGLSANLAGMSKNQLYDIMSQMKSLIEQNQQQARQILIQNPMLTKALFQVFTPFPLSSFLSFLLFNYSMLHICLCKFSKFC